MENRHLQSGARPRNLRILMYLCVSKRGMELHRDPFFKPRLPWNVQSSETAQWTGVYHGHIIGQCVSSPFSGRPCGGTKKRCGNWQTKQKYGIGQNLWYPFFESIAIHSVAIFGDHRVQGFWPTAIGFSRDVRPSLRLRELLDGLLSRQKMTLICTI